MSKQAIKTQLTKKDVSPGGRYLGLSATEHAHTGVVSLDRGDVRFTLSTWEQRKLVDYLTALLAKPAAPAPAFIDMVDPRVKGGG